MDTRTLHNITSHVQYIASPVNLLLTFFSLYVHIRFADVYRCISRCDCCLSLIMVQEGPKHVASERQLGAPSLQKCIC